MKDRLFIIILFLAAAIGIPQLFKTEAAELPREIRLYIAETDEIINVSPEEYLIGCLSAEIPLDYEQEALNAQAAASMTYALRLMTDLKDSGKIPVGADLSNDSKVCQPFFTEEQRLLQYGDSYEKYLPALKTAAKYGAAHIIKYKGAPIYAVYHSASAGKTCSGLAVWGRELDCISPVESKWDREFPNFECKNEMTAEQARLALVKYDPDIETPADYEKWFSDFNADENGYVISARIGDNVFSGGDLWRIFGLRSTAFTVSCSGGIFTFTTKGYGHGAGLSQYGANQMAKEGKSAWEIIEYYYSV